jgi:hypothetical protein
MGKKKAVPTTNARSTKQTLGGLPFFVRSIVPDSVDLRGRLSIPSIKVRPDEEFMFDVNVPVLNQDQTNARTGFALANVVYRPLLAAKREPRTP